MAFDSRYSFISLASAKRKKKKQEKNIYSV
jgi:hypothetical protein